MISLTYLLLASQRLGVWALTIDRQMKCFIQRRFIFAPKTPFSNANQQSQTSDNTTQIAKPPPPAYLSLSLKQLAIPESLTAQKFRHTSRKEPAEGPIFHNNTSSLFSPSSRLP